MSGKLYILTRRKERKENRGEISLLEPKRYSIVHTRLTTRKITMIRL